MHHGQFLYSETDPANWQLWDGGLRAAELDERQAQLVASQYRRRKEEAQLDSDIETAYANYLSSQAQLAASNSQVQLARQAFRESEQAWRLGAARQLDVISAEDQLRLADTARLQEERRVQLAIRRLRYLAGLE